MPFITQGKTNWKFLLVVVVLTAITGGGTLWYYRWTTEIETPYIKVISPNGGEKWDQGPIHNITWTSNGIGDHVGITILENHRRYQDLSGVYMKTIFTENDGSYPWTDYIKPLDNAYTVKIEDEADPSVYDESDGYFSVIGKPVKSITVISPNGGEQWVEGKTYDIIWRSSEIEKVRIGAATDKDSSVKHFAFSIAAELEKYSWRIPIGYITSFGIPKSDTARIRISNSLNSNIFDENDNYFTITEEDGITNGKTYKNEYGFEFKYPSDYLLKESGGSEYILLRRKEDEQFDWKIAIDVEKDDGFYNKEEEHESTTKLSFKDFVLYEIKKGCVADGPRGGQYCTDVVEISSFKNQYRIEGYEIYITEVHTGWVEIERRYEVTEEKINGPIFALDISQQTDNLARGILFGLTYSGREDEEKENLLKDLNQILSTFRFLD